MAFLATINDIVFDGNQVRVEVTYFDENSGFTAKKSFYYPSDGSVTQNKAVADITSVGQQLKANVAIMDNIKTKIGTVITI